VVLYRYLKWDHDISNLRELGAKREADLHLDQKVYQLALRTTVRPQRLLLTRKRKDEADRTATKRANKKQKPDEIEQNGKEEVEE
jgi:hypothetical protein